MLSSPYLNCVFVIPTNKKERKKIFEETVSIVKINQTIIFLGKFIFFFIVEGGMVNAIRFIIYIFFKVERLFEVKAYLKIIK